MFILQIDHKGKKYLIEWSLKGKGPAPGAKLLQPKDFESWLKDKKPELYHHWPEWAANLKNHGTNHLSRTASAAAFLEKSYYKPAGGQGQKWTPELLVEKFMPAEKMDQTAAVAKNKNQQQRLDPVDTPGDSKKKGGKQ
jgi:hypothetical protein